MMFKKMMWVALAASVLCLGLRSTAYADEWNKKTILTFSQPVEIPGHVLPAGTYTFKLFNSLSDRHIVQVFNADGSKIIATFMTIADYRLTPTDETVVRFKEMPKGSPEAIRAWFYPGNRTGQEFVYPKRRASELAMATRTVVPAADAADESSLKTASIVAVTPEKMEMPVGAVIRTTPEPTEAPASSARARTTALPHTASALPLIVLFGLLSIGLGVSAMAAGRASGVSGR